MVVTPGVLVDDSRPPVLRLTLNRPSSHNQLDSALIADLLTAVAFAERRTDIRILAVQATGDDFCSGVALDGSMAVLRERLTAVRDLLSRLATSPLVTVAVVTGAATGGGVGLAAVCDHVIVGDDASFRLTEVLVGLVPAIIFPALVRRVGLQRAYTMALLTEEISADRAVQIGLADTRSADPVSGLRHLVQRIGAADQGAVSALKRLRAELSAAAEPALVDGLPWVLAERLADPGLPERLDRLRANGLTS
ncbi:enoyl-CoA hydratase-related protein [Kribbella sp. NPDC051718]|uniref:enoyl-CoA hydratase-related protein n=1 Tax=Kribbella sp. NPDC051718 TaxID=3155168 RepID=UPI0034258702